MKGWTQIALSPWIHYTFRVVSVNDVGNSTPSASSPSFQAPSAGRYLLKRCEISQSACFCSRFSLKEYDARRFRLEGNDMKHGRVQPVSGSRQLGKIEETRGKNQEGKGRSSCQSSLVPKLPRAWNRLGCLLPADKYILSGFIQVHDLIEGSNQLVDRQYHHVQ